MRKMIPDRLRSRWSDRRIEKKKFSCSTFMMYLGIEGTCENLPHHTIATAADYPSNLADIEERHVLSDDPSIYVQNACVTDPTLAPKGTSTLYVLAPVSHQHPNIDWRIERVRFRDTVLKQLRKLGVQDLERRIRFEKIVTPADWQEEYAVYRGATFNLAHTLRQMLHLHRGIASRMWTGCISQAGAPTPAADCR